METGSLLLLGVHLLAEAADMFSPQDGPTPSWSGKHGRLKGSVLSTLEETAVEKAGHAEGLRDGDVPRPPGKAQVGEVGRPGCAVATEL